MTVPETTCDARGGSVGLLGVAPASGSGLAAVGRDAAGHVADSAETQRAEMIALAWSQRLEPGRAAAVRRTIRDAKVPVMLIPIPAG